MGVQYKEKHGLSDDTVSPSVVVCFISLIEFNETYAKHSDDNHSSDDEHGSKDDLFKEMDLDKTVLLV